jgi:hypothetical protein
VGLGSQIQVIIGVRAVVNSCGRAVRGRVGKVAGMMAEQAAKKLPQKAPESAT